MVIERHSSVAGAYCGRLLAMLGADVVKIEPPAGDPMRSRRPRRRGADGTMVSTLFEYLGAYKRSVVIAPDETDALRDVVRDAEVVIDYVDGDPDRAVADYERFAEDNPRLVYTAISGFGLTGPHRSFRSNDFLDFATGGYTFITGEPTREPLQGGGPWAGYVTGTVAAIATLAALRSARDAGRGQLVDVAAMEAVASHHQWTMVLYTHQGVVKRRAGNRHAESFHPIGPMPCADGWVCHGVATNAQWEGFCLAIDRPELLADERFQTGGDRFDHADELDELILPTLLERTTDELVRELQAQRVPASPVRTVEQALDDPQLASRGFWAASETIGSGAKMPARAFSVPGVDAPFRGAPPLGADTDGALRSRRSTQC